MPALGILFALCALFGWTFGDFFIQRGARTVGSWRTLFYIGAMGGLFLFPFVYQEIGPAFSHWNNAVIFGLLLLVTLFAALFQFEALKSGKIAIIEPVFSIELPITVGFCLVLWKETLNVVQALLMLTVFVGIMLAVTIHHTRLHYHKRIFEKGFVLAGIGAIGMALVNFLTGVSSQGTSPLLTIWILHGGLSIICLAYLFWSGEIKQLLWDFRRHRNTVLAFSMFDNFAWISFAFAVRYIPISIATTISESYIALTVLLGIFVNREKLKPHQLAGIALTIIGITILSVITS